MNTCSTRCVYESVCRLLMPPTASTKPRSLKIHTWTNSERHICVGVGGLASLSSGSGHDNVETHVKNKHRNIQGTMLRAEICILHNLSHILKKKKKENCPRMYWHCIYNKGK